MGRRDHRSHRRLRHRRTQIICPINTIAEEIVERGDTVPDLVDYARADQLGLSTAALDRAVETLLKDKETNGE